MLYELIMQGFGNTEDFNCAEKILYGANKAYGLKLSPESLKLAAGFGGGMGVESVCGTVTASTMVLSHLFVNKQGHESALIKELTAEFFSAFELEMHSVFCDKLKELHRTPETGCTAVIAAAAQVLDKIIDTHRQNIAVSH